ncbi:hypothetical protein F5X97DRAFT_319192 [Nemania serpens]|nr:hypothetical protein F5X97DRAFT_319192 [Nemania serpens]
MSHHCGGCYKTFKSRCVKQEHMIECRIHPGIYSLPGNTCATCIKVERAAEKRQKDEKKSGGKNEKDNNKYEKTSKYSKN